MFTKRELKKMLRLVEVQKRCFKSDFSRTEDRFYAKMLKDEIKEYTKIINKIKKCQHKDTLTAKLEK